MNQPVWRITPSNFKEFIEVIDFDSLQHLALKINLFCNKNLRQYNSGNTYQLSAKTEITLHHEKADDFIFFPTRDSLIALYVSCGLGGIVKYHLQYFIYTGYGKCCMFVSFQAETHSLPCALAVVSAQLLSTIFNISSILVTANAACLPVI